MVSTLTERGADVTLKALELGAVDFVAKPKIGIADGLRQLGDDITDKIRTAAQARVHRLAAPPAPAAASAAASGSAAPATPSPVSIGRLSTEKLIFIGASTGGTEATREVLTRLPADSPAVLITQHMPPGFTKSYAARLDGLCRIRVAEARDGERVLPGHAYIAPGGFHLSVERSGANYVARVRDGEAVNRHKPSVEAHRHGRRRRQGHEGAARRRQLQHCPGRSQLRGVRHAARSHCARRRARGAAGDADRGQADRAAAQHRRQPHHARVVAPAAPGGLATGVRRPVAGTAAARR
jgi:two-component system chemotaxis response regulator CheB